MKYHESWAVRALDAAEAAIRSRDEIGLQQALSALPLDFYTLMHFERPAEWPHFAASLPPMPLEGEQALWTGSHGWATMAQAALFLGDVLAQFGRDTSDARVLDYGCGWGRMVRLLPARFRASCIYGVDPWPRSQEHWGRLAGNLALTERRPERLPFRGPFDLIYAFSVFTHIGPETQGAALSAMRKHIAPDGMLALTVRPAAFWQGSEPWPDAETKARLLDQHMTHGLAFIENPPTEGGHEDYGRCSVSLKHIEREWTDWRVERVHWRASDEHQVTVFLRPV